MCQRAGARVLKSPPGPGGFEVGDILAVTAVAALISRRHAPGARRVLEILVQARQAPLGMTFIKAVETLLFEPEYADAFKPEDLTALIGECGDEMVREARVLIVEHRGPLRRGLVAHLYRNVRKVRRGT